MADVINSNNNSSDIEVQFPDTSMFIVDESDEMVIIKEKGADNVSSPNVIANTVITGEMPAATSEANYPGEDTLSKTPNSAFTKVVGINFPLLRLNDRYFNENEINSFEIDCSGFLPKVYASLTVVSDDIMKVDANKEGDILSVFLQPTEASYKSIRADFLITSTDLSATTAGNATQPVTIRISGELYIPDWYNSSDIDSVSGQGTSKDILQNIARKLKLGFFDNDEENTNDFQMWTIMKMPMPSPYDDQTRKLLSTQERKNNKISVAQSAIQHITAHAYKNFKSFFDSWIDLRYGLSFINVNKQLGEEGLDEKIDIVPFQNALTTYRAKDANAVESIEHQKAKAAAGTTTPQGKILTNVPGDLYESSPFKVLRYTQYSQAREVTEVIGVDKITNFTEGTHTVPLEGTTERFKFSIPVNKDKLENGFYIQIGPGQNLTYQQGDVKGYVNNNKIVEGGVMSDTQADSDIEQMQQTGSNAHSSGNHHKMYNVAIEHNKINNLQLQKKIIEVTLNGVNFAVMRGEKIPALICNMDRVNQIMSANPDSAVQRGLLEDYSGWFYIDAIKYRYAPNNNMTTGTPWVTELKLVRREWPIPGESAYPYTDDSKRQGELASGIDIITLDHSAGKVIESTDINKATNGESLSDVTTAGLATFMITLWDLIKKNISGVKLIQGRWWAVDDQEPPNREYGLPWVMWDDQYKCMDESGNVIYIKTTISNHFFGEAINIAHPKGTEYLMNEIINNDVILQYMYKNGVSGYNETWVGTQGAVNTIHLGTNTSEQANFWGLVWNTRPGTANKYAAYFEWNVHNTADPRKKIWQENPETRAKESESNSSEFDSGENNGGCEGIPLPDGNYTNSLAGKSKQQKYDICGIKGSAPAGTTVNRAMMGTANVKIWKDGQHQIAQLQINKNLVKDIEAICNEIAETPFKILSISSVGERPNNASFHPYGCAVDINPSQGCPWFANCYADNDFIHNKGRNMMSTIKELQTSNGKHSWTRANGQVYQATSKAFNIPAIYDGNQCIWSWDHAVVGIFLRHGWGWGGSYGDTMHFSITGG